MVIVSGIIASAPYTGDRNRIIIIRKTMTNAPIKLSSIPPTISSCQTVLRKVRPAHCA